MGISIDYYTNYETEEMLMKYNKFIEEYEGKIDGLIQRALEIEGFKLLNVYIGIGVVTKSEIKWINNDYRKVNEPTDVLSFPIFTKEELQEIKNNKCKEEILIGDIVLCMDVIENHAKEYGTGFNREMLYMIIHGVCHLLGYDHESETDKTRMRKLEEEILKGCV